MACLSDLVINFNRPTTVCLQGSVNKLRPLYPLTSYYSTFTVIKDSPKAEMVGKVVPCLAEEVKPSDRPTSVSVV